MRFTGKRLFVNVATQTGSLQVEILDEAGQVIEPLKKRNSQSITADATLAAVQWEGLEDLSSLCGKPVRFCFQLQNGRLYSFWVSPDETGASGGYVAAGGPGYTGHRDTVGRKALETVKGIGP